MESIEPARYEKGRPMLLGGLRQVHPYSESGSSIVEQWRQFKSIDRIPGRLGTNVYGVMCGQKVDGFEYMCAVEVENLAELPDNLGRMRIQAQEYGVFEHHGHRSTIRTTWARIFEWLTNCGAYQSAHRPDFEIYDETVDPIDGSGRVEIWVSISRKPDS